MIANTTQNRLSRTSTRGKSSAGAAALFALADQAVASELPFAMRSSSLAGTNRLPEILIERMVPSRILETNPPAPSTLQNHRSA
jgi:hypothetical protein